MRGSITGKIIMIALIGGACFVASMAVFGLVSERQSRYNDAHVAIANDWGQKEVLIGPLIIGRIPGQDKETVVSVLPDDLIVTSSLVPEVRQRGIFSSPVYTGTIKVSGTFSQAMLRQALPLRGDMTLAVLLTDTRGIEKEVSLSWNGKDIPFAPGLGLSLSDARLRGTSGFHALVPSIFSGESIPFSFEVTVRGSEGIAVAPIGNTTTLTLSSSWPSPKFTGPYLPKTRAIDADGFSAEWRISSFGRPYPDSWNGDVVSLGQVLDSSVGADLDEGLDLYDHVVRSIKYALLFIVVTFAGFFLFDVRGRTRIHPVQYLLVGCALALFYLLLLSLAEHIGFLAAYVIATVAIIGLVTFYSAFVLGAARRAGAVFVLLSLLYGYLYFVLQLEDYALLFGAILLFILLAVLMFATRRIDWYALDERKDV